MAPKFTDEIAMYPLDREVWPVGVTTPVQLMVHRGPSVLDITLSLIDLPEGKRRFVTFVIGDKKRLLHVAVISMERSYTEIDRHDPTKVRVEHWNIEGDILIREPDEPHKAIMVLVKIHYCTQTRAGSIEIGKGGVLIDLNERPEFS